MTIPTQHPYSFDPTYAYTPLALSALTAPPAPPNFDTIWRTRHTHARALNPAPRLTESQSTHPAWHTQDITYTSTTNTQITGWLLRPRNQPITRGLVIGHGYGGRDAPDFDIPVRDTALLFPCFRGLGRSAQPPISTDPQFHVLHDIDKPDRYILGGCVEDLWLAISALTQLHPALAGRIGYSGISFGGGIGALAIPWDDRIDRAQLTVPTFGNMPLWTTLPTTGSANAVQTYLKTHPEIRETLRVFDAATAATRIQIPTLIAVARFDPAVAPPCQFSIANAPPPGKHHETFILDAGHFDYPGMTEQHARLSAKVQSFFG